MNKPKLMATYTPPDTPLDIVHCDDDLVVVAKPSGLLSVPGKPAAHRDCLEHRVVDQIPDALLIHRLDLETSGLVVFARNKRAQKLINRQFENRIVIKTYQAKVTGYVKTDFGRIDLPLIADWPNRPLQKVCHETGKPSSTEWWALERSADATRLALRPLTGRSHQLRVHLSSIGHSILGDTFYGDADSAPRLLLHALSLALRHPADGRWRRWQSYCPF